MKLLVECFWITIAVLSGAIAEKFYSNEDTGRLRVIMIWFFISIAWLYGMPFIYFAIFSLGHLKDVSIDTVKVVLTLPMFVVMIFLYRFVKKGG